jgi:hypothetical protein
MAIVCNKKDCKYKKSVFCGLDYTMINEYGQCEVWYNWKGNVRQSPNYRPIEDVKAATEQESPHLENKTEKEKENIEVKDSERGKNV